MRTLIEELGDAYCESLRRVSVGHLRIEDAGERLRPAAELVSHLPDARARPKPRRCASSTACACLPSGTSGGEEGALRLMFGERLLAIARPQGGELVTEVVLA